jgi:hypothetical protein
MKSTYNNRRNLIACFKATEGLHPPLTPRLCHQHSFATLLVLSCLHSLGLRCSCCNVVRFFCDLEACNLVTATIIPRIACEHGVGITVLNLSNYDGINELFYKSYKINMIVIEGRCYDHFVSFIQLDTNSAAPSHSCEFSKRIMRAVNGTS